MNKTEMCSTLAFYGFQPGPAAMRSILEILTDWLQSLGLKPDQVAVERPELGDLFGTSDSVRAQLAEDGYEDVVSLDVIVSPPSMGGAIANFAAEGSCHRGYFAVVSVRESIASLSDGSMLPLANSLAESLDPEYGIGYRMELSLGPGWYAIGRLCGEAIEDMPEDGSPEDEAQLQISRWGNIGMEEEQVFNKGILRDVYPWNILNEAQRSAMVEGVKLEEWVRQDGARGRITSFTKALVLWEVDHAHLEGVRRVLKEWKIIFDYHDYLNSEADREKEEAYQQLIRWAESEKERYLAGGGKPEPFPNPNVEAEPPGDVAIYYLPDAKDKGEPSRDVTVFFVPDERDKQDGGGASPNPFPWGRKSPNQGGEGGPGT